MNFRYLPMTAEDKQQMLDSIGVASIDDLFADIPDDIRFTGKLDLQAAKSEQELTKELTQLANLNKHVRDHVSFLGAGVYDHYIPAIVDHVISRSEFYTAYTPYQPEISQGELQAIFEFQSMICECTGMEVANSSMYDGATALAEAAMVSCSHFKGKRNKILVAKSVHPEARAVLHTYATGQRLEVVELGVTDGTLDLDQLAKQSFDDVACVMIQYPNFFGQIEKLKQIETIVHEQGALLVVSSNPLALGVLTPPGAFGADIVVGDAQVFGIPEQFGGPHCGYFATTKKLMRKLPGRIVGQTVDEAGKRGFVLTLQAREQHIRREKATSNICSNQALNALAASVAMTALGKKGLKEMAVQNVSKAQFAKQAFAARGFKVRYQGPFFNEFVIECKRPIKQINLALMEKGIIGGYDLGRDYDDLHNHMLICVTEQRTQEEIVSFVKEMGDLNE